MVGSLLVCLVILGLTALADGNTLPQNKRDRRNIFFNDKFSLMSEVTFESNGDCSIFGHYLTESVCRWVLRDKYDIYRFYYFTFVSPSPYLSNAVEMFRNGSCILGRELLDIDDCRDHMGTSRYDRVYVVAFGLPDVEIDEEGYCMMGDTELAPDDCPVMIGEAVYRVLVSIKSNS